MLLIMFIPEQRGRSSAGDALADAWRRGDADTDTRIFMDGFRDFPSLADRLLTNRNRKWIPKIEGYLHCGKTYFVVTGSSQTVRAINCPSQITCLCDILRITN